MIKKLLYLIIVMTMIGLLAGCGQQKQSYQGYVEGYFTYLSSNSDGFLQELDVNRGDSVAAGETLFVLENQPQALQLAQAEEKLQQAQAELNDSEKGQRATVLQGIQQQIQQAAADMNLAKKTLDRNQQLLATGAISKQQYDETAANFQSANAKLKQLMANLSEAELGSRTDVIAAAQAAVSAADAEANLMKWYLDKMTVTAPAAGTVYDTYYRLGEFVTAGHAVVAMLIPSDVRALFYIPEPQLSKLGLGQRVTINCDGCGKPTTAIISFISAKAEYTPPTIFSENERNKFVYRVEATFSPQDVSHFHPGQPVDVTLMSK